MRGVSGVLLAAGSSRRFGRDKQSVLVEGVPMLERAARTLLEAGFAAPVVVLGAHAAEHRELLSGLPVRIVENTAADTGMASSLVAALAALPACEAIVVTVCDQLAVTAQHLHALGARWRQGGVSIVASSYDDARGVPALFAAAHFAALRRLRGDRGAGALLSMHEDTLALVPLPGGALDVDTPADLERYTRGSG